jgi:hypothetical protein
MVLLALESDGLGSALGRRLARIIKELIRDVDVAIECSGRMTRSDEPGHYTRELLEITMTGRACMGKKVR